MPPSRKQKVEERQSRQIDIMSVMENVDMLLGSSSIDDERNDQSEDEANLKSGSNRPKQTSKSVGEDFRSLLNTNSRENSDMTVETIKIVSDEVTNRVTRRLKDIRASLNFQIEDAIRTAIAEKVLPSIQNTLEGQSRCSFAVVDRKYSGLQGRPAAVNPQEN